MVGSGYYPCPVDFPTHGGYCAMTGTHFKKNQISKIQSKVDHYPLSYTMFDQVIETRTDIETGFSLHPLTLRFPPFED